jgi:hypothetical protein
MDLPWSIAQTEHTCGRQGVHSLPGKLDGNIFRHEIGRNGAGMLAELVGHPFETGFELRPERLVCAHLTKRRDRAHQRAGHLKCVVGRHCVDH